MNSHPVKPPAGRTHTGLKTLVALLVISLVGLLIGLRTVAGATLPHILSTTPGIDYQNMVDGMPTPRLLDWNQTQIDVLTELRALSGIGLLLAGACLYATLVAVALRVLNPNFRLVHTVPAPSVAAAGSQPPNGPQADEQPPADHRQAPSPENDHADADAPPIVEEFAAPTPAGAALDAAIEPLGLIKIVRILLLFGLPLIGFWLLSGRWDTATPVATPMTGDVGRWSWIWALRLALLGAALWVGFHPAGLAGTSERKSLNLAPRAWPMLAGRGIVFGLCAFGIGRAAVPGALEPVLLRYQALGAFNITYWHQVMAIYLSCMGLAWFAAGIIFILLARPGLRTAHHLTLFAALCIAMIAAGIAQMPFQASVQAVRQDLTRVVLETIPMPYHPDRRASGVPDGPRAARELAQRLGLTADEQQPTDDRNVLLFNDDSDPLAMRVGTVSRVLNVIQSGATTDGLKPTARSAALAAEFLRRRNYQSGLSWVAVKHRFDVAAYHFDTTAAITACLDDLRSDPHPTAFSPHLRFFHTQALQISQTLRSLFFICAATPENLAQLDRWADLNNFSYPDRQSLRQMGDLYRRFGDVKRALMWYRKADMPHTFMNRIRSEKPLFHTGHVTGVLRLNGRPLAGVQVGMVPERLNGLPLDLEGYVRTAIEDILSPHPGGPWRGPFNPVPEAFRWISASTVTDRNGAFTVDRLTEGEYHLICTLPSDVHLYPPLDRRLRIVNPPMPFNVSYGNQNANLGIIDMFIDK